MVQFWEFYNGDYLQLIGFSGAYSDDAARLRDEGWNEGRRFQFKKERFPHEVVEMLESEIPLIRHTSLVQMRDIPIMVLLGLEEP